MVVRARAMVSHWRWWKFLNSTVLNEMHSLQKDAFPAPIPQTSWLSLLLRHIGSLYNKERLHSREVPFKTVYGMKDHAFASAKLTNLRLHLVDQELRDVIAQSSISVLAQWLHLQPQQRSLRLNANSTRGDVWHLRGLVVDAFISFHKPGMLCMPVLYKVFYSPVNYVVDGAGAPSTEDLVATIQRWLLDVQHKKNKIQDLHKKILPVAPDLVNLWTTN